MSEFESRDVEATARTLRTLAEKQRGGDRRVAPQELFFGLKETTVEPAIELVIIDSEGKYCLQRRPPGESVWGAGKLHIIGGFLKASPKYPTIMSDGLWMAREECDFENVSYVAGPIAIYRWQNPEEHPFGHPVSMLYVAKMEGPLPNRDDLVWFEPGTVPAEREMIQGPGGHGGRIHFMLLRAFNRAALRNFDCACIDLNERPLNNLPHDFTS